jgi:hypothetical protein
MHLQYQLLKAQLAQLNMFEQIDLYLEQYEQEGEQFATPAVFVEFMPIEWQSYTQRQQKGLLTFRTHLVIQTLYGDEQVYIDQANLVQLPYLAQEVYKALHCRSLNIVSLGTPIDCVLLGNICRVRTEWHHCIGNLAVHIDTWQAQTLDTFAMPELLEHMATLDLTYLYTKSLNDAKP